MRRCSSDPYLELHQADRVQQSSYIACPAGARERWKWAFRMTRRFCKVYPPPTPSVNPTYVILVLHPCCAGLIPITPSSFETP